MSDVDDVEREALHFWLQERDDFREPPERDEPDTERMPPASAHSRQIGGSLDGCGGAGRPVLTTRE